MSAPVPAGHQAAALGALAVHQHEKGLPAWSMIRLDVDANAFVVYVPDAAHATWAESLAQHVTRRQAGSLVTDGTLPAVGVRIRIRSAVGIARPRPKPRRHLAAVRP